jgi:hypothetical protein
MPFSRGITRGYATQRTEDLTGPGLESHAVEGDDALLHFTRRQAAWVRKSGEGTHKPL